MKIKSDYVLRRIGDDCLAVPLCEEADRIRGMIRLSESGAFLWELLEQEQTAESLAADLMERYGIDAALAKESVESFVGQLQANEILE